MANEALIGAGKRANHAFLDDLVREKEKQGKSFGWIGVCCEFSTFSILPSSQF